MQPEILNNYRRVNRFRNEKLNKEFKMHKPHPSNILKMYQLNDIKLLLLECNLIKI